MGEATFTKPIIQWLEKRRARKEAARLQAAPPPQEDQSASVHEIFNAQASPRTDPGAPTQSDLLREATVPRASPEASIEVNRLAPDLAQEVFGRRAAPPAREASVPEPQGVHLPGGGPVSRVRIGVPSGGAMAEGAAGARRREGVSTQSPGTQPNASDLQGVRPDSEEAVDSLPMSLQDIFRRKVVANPQVRALLQRHGAVDTRELADELRDFARSVGATRSRR